MKKIMVFISILHNGGAERVASVICNALAMRGQDVHLLLYGRAEDEYELNNKVKVNTIAKDYDAYSKLSAIEKVKRIRKIVKTVKPDFIMNFLPEPQIWMMLSTFGLRKKKIETVRSNPWVMTEHFSVEGLLWKMCLKKAYRIMIQTQEQEAFFGKRSREKCVLIPNPLKKEFLSLENQWDNRKTQRMIAVGRLVESKNYPMMIQAFAEARKQCSDLTLDIYGYGSEDEIKRLQQMIDEEGCTGAIRLMGKSNNMESIYRQYGTFLMTSNFEGLSNALIEAMASGCVCICTDCKTGPKDLIEDGANGFLTPIKDYATFADKIILVNHLSYEQKIQISEEGVERIRKLCDWDKTMERIEQMIEEK